jgi:Trk K+ transport system NAD-binding subunit
MSRYLVIGAGTFGRELTAALQRTGAAVDVIDKEASASCGLTGNYRFFCDNALNRSALSRLEITGYDGCYLCIGGDAWMRSQIVSHLHAADAKHIVVRIYAPKEERAVLSAGAERAVRIEQLAGQMLAACAPQA